MATITIEVDEDAEDIREAEAALREAEHDGFIPWEEVKATHDL